jgi:trimethylamine--corrinoid protein Co-methyltransferase
MQPTVSQIPSSSSYLRTLSEEQAQQIHAASLSILEGTGIDLREPTAVELLTGHGASIGKRGRVHIPAEMVEQALQSVPPTIPMHNRLGELTMPLEAGKVYFGTGSDTLFTIDPETGERRNPTRKDITRIARLCDALPNISFVMTMGTVWDAPSADTFLEGFIAMLRGSAKPLVFTASDRQDMEQIWQIAAAVAGGAEQLRQKPFLLNYSEPISPLLFPVDSVQKLLFCAEKGIPAAFPPSANMGGGGPVTMAGALALANAENLAGMVMHQLTAPGAPFLYGSNVSVLDMRDTVICYGSPEWSLSMAALADLARFYGLPVWGYAGATDSKEVDAQAGAEAMLSIYSAYLSQSTLNHDVGYIESGSTSSMEMILLADEMISMVRYFAGGVAVDGERLALEFIDQANAGSGFLSTSHTLDHWRKSLFLPRLLNRQRYDTWAAKGKTTLSQRLNHMVRNILSKHETQPLPVEVEGAISAVLAKRNRNQ